MIIESVDLKDYRNYKILNMNFNPQINIIYGDNAQGKTNILEALYVCATSRSHKGSKDREMIRMGSDEAHIKLNVKKNGLPYRIDMHLKKNKSKGIAVNGIPIKRAVELFGILNIVCFSPEDLSIIKNGPAERRRFMDMELITLLEEKEMLYRTHGSAILINPYINDRHVNEKEKSYPEEKRLIGRYAASLITADDSILIASGTTMHALAREIVPQGHLTVIAAAINVTNILARNKNIDIIQLGGFVRNSSVSVVGNYAEKMLENFSCSKLFMGVDGIDLDYGAKLA